MKKESIDELRNYLVEFLLDSQHEKLTKEELYEAAVWMNYIYQPETYEENRKAIQKVMEKHRGKK